MRRTVHRPDSSRKSRSLSRASASTTALPNTSVTLFLVPRMLVSPVRQSMQPSKSLALLWINTRWRRPWQMKLPAASSMKAGHQRSSSRAASSSRLKPTMPSAQKRGPLITRSRKAKRLWPRWRSFFLTRNSSSALPRTLSGITRNVWRKVPPSRVKQCSSALPERLPGRFTRTS